MSDESPPAVANPILVRMRDRLFAGLLTGPSLNCRPHSSRQRIDWCQLAKLGDLAPDEAFQLLLTGKRQAKLTARVEPPPATARFEKGRKRFGERDPQAVKTSSVSDSSTPQTAPENGAGEVVAVSSPSGASRCSSPGHASDLVESEKKLEAWNQQKLVLTKLRTIADDAKTYEQDTGVHVLNVGFPLLSLPAAAGKSGWGSRRVLAPIAFIPVVIACKAGATTTIEIAGQADGVDAVIPNSALLAWLQQQHGDIPDEVFADEEGRDPWREISELVRVVAERVQIDVPEVFRKQEPSEQSPPLKDLVPIPKSDDEALTRPAILHSAVLGLFPMNNQGLLRDTMSMVAEPASGPLRSFLDVSLEAARDSVSAPMEQPPSRAPQSRNIGSERFIAPLDPCQARAVRMARDCATLVIHGPPGTGKSQTITNIIGDHLARGERVLMVCDKRTALDVVANRLEHLGLGDLLALVHDPQHDQRDLYRAIREQLESLSEKSPARPDDKGVKKLDTQLLKVHGELTAVWSELMTPGPNGRSFHDLAGEWLAAGGPDGNLAAPGPSKMANGPPGLETPASLKEHGPLTLDQLEQHEAEIRHALRRVEEIDLLNQAWNPAAGITLAEFLARPVDLIRSRMQSCVDAAVAVDVTSDPRIPPFSASQPFPEQSRLRSQLATDIEAFQRVLPLEDVANCRKLSAAAIRRLHQQITAAGPLLEIVRRGPLDPGLSIALNGQWPSLAVVFNQLAPLTAWLSVAERWYGFVFFGRRSAAATVLRGYGLPVTPDAARGLHEFLDGIRARLTLQVLLNNVTAELRSGAIKGQPPATCLEDEILVASVEGWRTLLGIWAMLGDGRPEVGSIENGLNAALMEALGDPSKLSPLVEGLKKSAPRAQALETLDVRTAEAHLFYGPWLQDVRRSWLANGRAGPVFQTLFDELDDLDDVLRVRHQLGELPPVVRPAVYPLLVPEAGPPGEAFEAEASWLSIKRSVLQEELAGRLQTSPALAQIDPARLDNDFSRYLELERQKQSAVQELIVQQWLARQQERLLVSTGSRLSAQGADLRRRLALRGEKAMRLRQVISVGQNIAGGDPLFDLRPLWMASPETVAQIFPRLPMFDVVVFDEASQCRLEEALPVLTRAKRVVIAGDPKQLPPTRFFESAVTLSEQDEPETEQQLFESHQSEVEDLLDAALGLSIPQCYLDVHYRSRNADLIAFSNEQFYSSRLQPIPGNPALRPDGPPIVLHQVDGTYEDRQNPAEADAVCEIVRELLSRPQPPSIGIACFNLSQRDLISERLNETAEEDAAFAAKLAEARERRGEASFEGLFVKNLENVQGDERDQMIISTTYGPDPKGRFYRRFGPLGREGGGRRLNVLVTRARQEVHLVTSIPQSVYSQLPPIPTGQTAGGGWLLFAYLNWARRLAELYAEAEDSETGGDDLSSGIRTPSGFAKALGSWLWTRHGRRSDVHWGNDGFCVDVALRDDKPPHDIRLGVLCDGTRYAQSDDPAAWDAFRQSILEATGWKLQRLWTPVFLRDPKRCAQSLLK